MDGIVEQLINEVKTIKNSKWIHNKTELPKKVEGNVILIKSEIRDAHFVVFKCISKGISKGENLVYECSCGASIILFEEYYWKSLNDFVKDD